MSRRTDPTQSSFPALRHLFIGTALLGMVFGTGVIVGQRLLLQEGLPPLIAVGEAATSPPAPGSHSSEQDTSSGSSVFSFYEVLTNAEVQDLPLAGDGLSARPEPAPKPIKEELVQADSANSEAMIEGARYTLQVGSHPTMERARAEMDRLRALSLEPHVVATEVVGQGQFYRVRLGKFATMEQAQHVQRQLRADQDVQSFVTPL